MNNLIWAVCGRWRWSVCGRYVVGKGSCTRSAYDVKRESVAPRALLKINEFDVDSCSSLGIFCSLPEWCFDPLSSPSKSTERKTFLKVSPPPCVKSNTSYSSVPVWSAPYESRGVMSMRSFLIVRLSRLILLCSRPQWILGSSKGWRRSWKSERWESWRVINVKFLLQPHQDFCIAQYEELGIS